MSGRTTDFLLLSLTIHCCMDYEKKMMKEKKTPHHQQPHSAWIEHPFGSPTESTDCIDFAMIRYTRLTDGLGTHPQMRMRYSRKQYRGFGAGRLGQSLFFSERGWGIAGSMVIEESITRVYAVKKNEEKKKKKKKRRHRANVRPTVW